MTKDINKYKGRFSQKHRTFNILQNNIEEFVKLSTQIWKIINGLQIEQAIEQGPIELGEDNVEQEVVDIKHDESIREGHEECTVKEENIEATVEEEKQKDLNVPEVHIPSAHLPHVEKVDQQEKIVKIKDVSDNTTHSINPFIEEDIKKILVDSTTKEKLCSHPILVNVDEIEKAKLASTKEKAQELSIPPPPPLPPQSTKVQPIIPIVVYQRKETISSHVSTLVQIFLVHVVSIVEKYGIPVLIGQEASPAPTTQAQGDTEITKKEKDRIEDSVLSMKLEEVIAIQTLVTILDTATSIPSQALHRLSVEATPLYSSRPIPSTYKVDEVISYGDINLDEVIEIPNFNLASITIEKMSILQDALARKKHQELL